MKILKLEAENVKRVKAVEITPTGAIVQITGKNMQGKSSVLDAIEMALAGGKMPKTPIRRGATSAKISLDLGDIKVTRKFAENGGTTLVVESDKGARFSSPQKMLDELIGSISFDPLAFSRMDPRAQFDTLRQVASVDADLDALAGKNLHDREERTEVNRKARAARAGADAITVPDDVPEENSFDLDALLSQMQMASKTNSDIEKRQAGRDQAISDISRYRAEASELEEQVRALRNRASALEERLENAEPLPTPIDIDELRLQIEVGRKVAHLIGLRTRKRELEAEATDQEAKAQALTDAITARDDAKDKAIAAAKMPIPDITLGDGIVVYKGLPFDQASSAEQLRVSVSIAMAANPKLRVLRIKEGGLLDEDGMKLLTEMVEASDYQCWVETVIANGPVAVEMVDGQAKGAVQVEEKGEAGGKLL